MARSSSDSSRNEGIRPTLPAGSDGGHEESLAGEGGKDPSAGSGAGYEETLAGEGGKDPSAGSGVAYGETLSSPAAGGAAAGYVETMASAGGGPGAPLALTSEAEGRYLVRGELASGGQSQVFVAYDTHLGREIALKQPRSSGDPQGSGSRNALGRFLREAQITARLEHPNIVPIYEIGERKDGTYYCAQKLIRSGDETGRSRTLRSALDRARTLRERLRLLPHFLDVCHAIAYAHEKGVIHRDIKPDNVVIGRLGETIVLDWGLAKVIGGSDVDESTLDSPDAGLSAQRSPAVGGLGSPDGATEAGMAFGTPSYMSPEQAAGDVDAIDERSDIFSLGALLHEILTGAPPFVGDSAVDIIQRVRSESPAPIRSRHPQVPPALAAVAEKALSRAPDGRYQRAAGLAEDIGAYEAGLRVGVYQYSLLELARLFVARHRAVSTIAMLALLLLAISSGVAWRNYHQAEDYLGDAQENLAFAFIEKARRAERNLQWDRAAAFYAAARTRADLPEARWGAMLAKNRGWLERRRVFEHESDVGDLAFSRGGDLVAVAGSDGTLAVFDLKTGRERASFRAEGALYAVAFSPSGNDLATVGEGGWLRLLSLETGEEDRIFRHDDAINAVTFSPDGARIAIGTEDSWLKVYDLTEERFAFERELPKNPMYVVEYTPDGDRLAVACYDGRVRFFDPESGEVKRMIEAHSYPFTMDISPDGDLLATGGRHGVGKIWRVSDGALVHELEAHTHRMYGLSFSHDGERLATGSTDKTLRLWNVETGQRLVGESYGTGTSVRALSFSPSENTLVWAGGEAVWLGRFGNAPERSPTPIASLAVSPDGSQIAYPFGGQLRFRDTSNQKVARIHVDVRRAGSQGRFSPGGSWYVALACERRKVCAWDAESRELLWKIEVAEWPTEVAISPDGRLLAVGTQDGGIEVWDTSRRERVRDLETPYESQIYSLDFSPDGEILASGGWETKAILWDTESWEERSRLEGHSHAVRRIRFSPDGKLVATASLDLSVRLWDPESGEQVEVLEGHEDYVNGLAFDPKGRFVVSASLDGTLRVWNLDDMRELAAFVTDEAHVYAVEMFPEGDRLAYAGHAVHVLELGDLDSPEDELQRVLGDADLALRGIELERREGSHK